MSSMYDYDIHISLSTGQKGENNWTHDVFIQPCTKKMKIVEVTTVISMIEREEECLKPFQFYTEVREFGKVTKKKNKKHSENTDTSTYVTFDLEL